MSIEFYVKVRDGAQQIADACQEQLAIMEPKDANWDPSKIKWVQTEGSRGPYYRYPAAGEKAESTSDYRNLINDLLDHKEKLARDGFFYWLFSDGATIGRKKRKTKAKR